MKMKRKRNDILIKYFGFPVFPLVVDSLYKPDFSSETKYDHFIGDYSNFLENELDEERKNGKKQHFIGDYYSSFLEKELDEERKKQHFIGDYYSSFLEKELDEERKKQHFIGDFYSSFLENEQQQHPNEKKKKREREEKRERERKGWNCNITRNEVCEAIKNQYMTIREIYEFYGERGTKRSVEYFIYEMYDNNLIKRRNGSFCKYEFKMRKNEVSESVLISQLSEGKEKTGINIFVNPNNGSSNGYSNVEIYIKPYQCLPDTSLLLTNPIDIIERNINIKDIMIKFGDFELTDNQKISLKYIPRENYENNDIYDNINNMMFLISCLTPSISSLQFDKQMNYNVDIEITMEIDQIGKVKGKLSNGFTYYNNNCKFQKNNE